MKSDGQWEGPVKAFGTLAICFWVCGMSLIAAEPLRVHMISGAKEYKSEASLRDFKEYLRDKEAMTVTAAWVSDGAKHLPNLEELKEAEVLLVFARRMKLAEEDMAVVRSHWEAGKPVVGVRTASHAFSREENQVFDHKVLGGNYTGHFGDEQVRVRNLAEEHEVLKGVEPFSSRRLYKAGPLARDSVVLQTGTIGEDMTEPVTWVHEFEGGRTFYTSLGVPEDFEKPAFRRMLRNAILWVAEEEL